MLELSFNLCTSMYGAKEKISLEFDRLACERQVRSDRFRFSCLLISRIVIAPVFTTYKRKHAARREGSIRLHESIDCSVKHSCNQKENKGHWYWWLIINNMTTNGSMHRKSTSIGDRHYSMLEPCRVTIQSSVRKGTQPVRLPPECVTASETPLPPVYNFQLGE